MKQRSVALAIALFGKEAADKWWNTPNRTFEGRTPAGVWLEKPEDVYNYLMRFA